LHLANGFSLLEHFVKTDAHVIRDALGEAPEETS